MEGSSLGGDTVLLSSGNNINVIGSNVVSDNGTALIAKNNVSIVAAQNTYEDSNFSEQKQSGLMGTGGVGFAIDKREQSGNGASSSSTSTASTVGAINGNVTIHAGNTYTQTGSDVVAPGGDIDIHAKTVSITEARETSQSQYEQHASQSGLTVSLSSPVVSAVQGIADTARATGNTSDARMKGLGVASAAMQAHQLGNSLADAQMSSVDAATGKLTTPDGIDKMGGINLNISLGGSKSQSSNRSQSDTARASTVKAGGNVNITATGGGQDSNIVIQGSEIQAGKQASLYADNQVLLRAAENTSSQASSNSASAGSVGVSIGLGSQGPVAFNASASKASGNANGSDSTYTNAHVGGNTVAIHSGGNTTLDGAVVAGNRVTADIGGDLLIGSRQDTSNYTSQQKSTGGSISVSPLGVPVGGSLSAGKSNINSSYASVSETSGLKAGDGGFDVQVKGKTTLQGGVITSTDRAVTEGKNTFVPQGGVTITDITNTASYSGSGYSVGISAGVGKGSQGREIVTPGGSAGVANVGEQVTSVTRGGVSGFVGDMAARTGDASTGIAPIFDAAKVQKDIDAQVKITSDFGKEASRTVGDYAKAQTDKAEALRTQAEREPDRDRAAALNAQAQSLDNQWGDNGTMRLALHTVIGGLTSGLSGASGSLAGTLTAPEVAKALNEAGINGPVAQAIVALASTGAGVAVGGISGGAAAFNEVTNNYLRHDEQTQKAQGLAACKTEQCKKDLQAQWDEISQNRNKFIIESCLSGGTEQCSINIKEMTGDWLELHASGGDKSKGYTGFTPEERNNIKQVMSLTATNLEVLAARGNSQLGTTYSSPDDLVKVGILSEREGELLKSSRADNMVGFLGAIALPSGTKTRNADTNKAASLFDEMTAKGIKVTPENVIRAEKLPDGRIVFLEKGNEKSGFEHIMKEHGIEFSKMGLSAQ